MLIPMMIVILHVLKLSQLHFNAYLRRETILGCISSPTSQLHFFKIKKYWEVKRKGGVMESREREKKIHLVIHSLNAHYRWHWAEAKTMSW